MVTKVGLEHNFSDALIDLVQLDFDAAEAYSAAINRLTNQTYRDKLSQFRNDHKRHITEITDLLNHHGEIAPSGPSMGKSWLTKGKVIIANLMGENAILAAMHSNEIDTNTAYERVLHHDDIWNDAIAIIQKGFNDEKQHKEWLEAQLKNK